MRQRCCTYPTLFNIYNEELINEALQRMDGMITVEGITVVKYTDDR